MATSNGQRVAAFFLASLFLVSTIATTAYIIWQINKDDGVLVNETPEEKAEADSLGQCGSGTYAAVDPRPVPTTVTSDPVTELQKIDIKTGDGEEVQPGDCVAVLYYGTVAASGAKFDGNYEAGEPLELSLDRVISGWSEGIPGMKVGGVRRLVIPAAQAYGDQEVSSIPANSDLIFEVEVVATKRGEN